MTVSPDRTEAGSYALLTFAVPHGCEGSATTKVTIDLPDEGIGPVTPSVNPNWDVERIREGGDPQGDVQQVVYTAKTPLPDDLRDSFELSTLILPDAEGQTLVFPVLQTCEDGETAWDQVPEQGQDAHELDSPAPAFTVTAAGGQSAGDGEDAGAEEAPESPETTTEPTAAETSPPAPAETGDESASDEGSSLDPLAVTGLGLGIAGVVLGGIALLRTRSGRGDARPRE